MPGIAPFLSRKMLKDIGDLESKCAEAKIKKIHLGAPNVRVAQKILLSAVHG